MKSNFQNFFTPLKFEEFKKHYAPWFVHCILGDFPTSSLLSCIQLGDGTGVHLILKYLSDS